MSGTFNGYHVWLGIPLSEQPPNHYRLLGISIFESDLDVVEHAADRQMAHVRTFQSGKHGSLSQQILNELAAARLCLLNSEKKASYDQELRGQQSTPKAVPVAKAVPVSPAMPVAQAVPIATAVPLGNAVPQAKPIAAPQAATAPPRVAPVAVRTAPAVAPESRPAIKSVEELALELGGGAREGIQIRVKRRKYNQSAWQGSAFLGMVAGILVIGFLGLYFFLLPWFKTLSWEDILRGPAVPEVAPPASTPVDRGAPSAPAPANPAQP